MRTGANVTHTHTHTGDENRGKCDTHTHTHIRKNAHTQIYTHIHTQTDRQTDTHTHTHRCTVPSRTIHSVQHSIVCYAASGTPNAAPSSGIVATQSTAVGCVTKHSHCTTNKAMQHPPQPSQLPPAQDTPHTAQPRRAPPSTLHTWHSPFRHTLIMCLRKE